MSRISRRALLGAFGTAGLAVAACARSGAEQEGACPSLTGRRLRWIVPNAAGGGYDTESRLVRPHLEERLGARILIDNQAGAGGMVGARAIAAAPPDGRTLGIIGAPGLLVAALTGETMAPGPTAFTILGRIARSWHVWATGARSGLAGVEDAVTAAARRPLVCGINEVGSANFVSVAAASALLGVEVEFVGGFAGNRAASLAAIRGDVDLVCFNFETIRDLFEAGDLRPLLQVSSRPIDAGLAGVPCLGGGDGQAAARARLRGEDPERARERADALAQVIGAGRIVVAPAGLPAQIEGCLAEAVAGALTSPALRASTRRALDPATGEEARRDVAGAVARAAWLVPVVREALARIRGTR